MSTENLQNDQLPQNDDSDKVPNPQNQIQEENPGQPQKIEILQDSTDQVKNMIQPLGDKISKIDSIFQSAEAVPVGEQNMIITKEIPGKQITTSKSTKTTTKTITKTIIKNGVPTTTIEKFTTVEENNENKETENNENTLIKKVIINENDKNDLNNEEKEIKPENDDEIQINVIKEQNDSPNSNMISNVIFGAPDKIDYKSTISGSNFTFGVNNSNVNLNQNNINNNSNISDSVDKSSETGNNIIIEQKNENDSDNNQNQNDIKIQFGFKETQNINDKGEIKSTPKKEENLKLVDNIIKFGYVENKDNKEKENNMEIEPGEIKDEEDKEIKEEQKIEKKKKKEEKKESIFTKSLFNNNEDNSNNQVQSSIFNQKLFQNVDSNKNNLESNINLFQDKNINPLFGSTNKNQETFLKNNISLIPPSNQTITTNLTNIITNPDTQNSEITSAAFGTQNNPQNLKTLNDIIIEGDVYNADSAKKTQTNPNIFTTINPNLSNEDSNLNINIQAQSLNKGINPFKPNEPQMNININSNVGNNNLDTNDNIETNESTINPGIKINMVNNDKKISSPFANYAVKDDSKTFFLGNEKANEISVNPILTSTTNPFSQKIETNKGKEEENIHSGLFPGLGMAINKKSHSEMLDNKNRPNPIFPGSNEETKSKTSFFIDTDKEKPKEENKEKGNVIFSEVLFEGMPKIPSQENKNPFAEKPKEKEDNNINTNNQDSYLPNPSSLFGSNFSANKENEEKKEEIINNNKPEELSNENKEKLPKNDEDEIQIQINLSDNKENENPEEINQIQMSKVLNSNLSPENIIKEEKDKDKEKEGQKSSSPFQSLFNNVDKNPSQIQAKEESHNPKKSLFGDLFLKKDESNKSNLSNLELNNKNNSSPFFSSGNDLDIYGNKVNTNKDNIEPKNIFGNNQGKSLFEVDNGSSFLGKETTPIKSINLFNKENKENKDNKSEEEISIEINNKDEEDKKEEKEQLKKKDQKEGETEEIKEIKEIKEVKPKEEIIEIPIINMNNNSNIINENKENDKQDVNKPETKFGEDDALSDYEVENTQKYESIPSDKIIQRKPLNKKIYSELIKKIYKLTENNKNKINIPKKKIVTIYDNTLNQFLKDFEDKIIILKKCYIETLIKRHFEKYPSKKKQIIYEANLPKKRNDLKKIYHEMVKVINEKLKEKDNQKYYYILILNILKKHENIEQKEINDELKLYKNNLKNKEKENRNKVIKKSKKNGKTNWSVNIGNLLIFLIPMAFAAYYLNTNIK